MSRVDDINRKINITIGARLPKRKCKKKVATYALPDCLNTNPNK